MNKKAAILAGAMVVGAASPAAALGLKYGARLGTGITFPDPEPDGVDISVFAGGLGVLLDLAIIGIEIDAMYLRHSASKGDATDSWIALPALGRFNFPVIPAFLSLDFFAGLEYRLGIGAEAGGKDFGDDQQSPLYLPVGIGGTLDLKIIQLNLDMRYERQLTAHSKGADDARIHELLFMAGAFF